MSELPILIVGGAGKTGARVDALLRASGVPTRPVSRSTPVPFDWTRPETWPAALAGVSMAYVTYQPDLAVEGASDAIAEVSRLARENGLQRVVLLSGRGEPGAQQAEAALQQSGVPWTIVRASWFDQNSPKAICSTACWPVRSPCRPATCPNRSSTPTTSPRSSSRR
jgi:uncharacterized protein YbjT (DUF2867 family)